MATKAKAAAKRKTRSDAVTKPIRSDLPIPPGEMLTEELAARGMTQRELALRTGRPEQAISEIVNAKKAITPETALAFETVLGPSAEFWLGLQTTYELTLAREKGAGRVTYRNRSRSGSRRRSRAVEEPGG